ncbi:hypothetical protein [Mesorhizobium huakuii]|uniref:Uncharacterized protein n=1 Tax=Mesorhizobium huakuii TaxID=28104 RepID=A0A7G6SUN6_9HYPH|nr:hypothetical protein [Mesorhizobium huakuii]QND58218.1 hypothetical protein HB778_17685 [Mesorhizobium huakuii]
MAEDQTIKVYIVNFDATEITQPQLYFRLGSMNQFCVGDPDVIAYWNYIPLLYMLKSRQSAATLARKLVPILGDRFLIAAIDPFNIDGQMLPAAWDWLYFDHEAAAKSKLLGGMLPAS